MLTNKSFMEYYKLSKDITCLDCWYLGDVNVEDNWIFTEGTPINANKFKGLSIEIDKDGIPLDFTENDAFGVPIVSGLFAERLSKYMKEVQLIPINIPEINGPYYILVI